MTLEHSSKQVTRSCPIIRARIHLVRLMLYLNEASRASASPEQQRAEIETPYIQGSAAAEDYIDGYLDYRNASTQHTTLQCRGDRSSYYGQGWQACANETECSTH